MANTTRRRNYVDRNGNMFIPMNVEGGVWNEHFITTPKFICIVLMALSFAGIFMILGDKDRNSTVMSYVVYIGLWAIISSFVLRFIIFEEKFYYRMYKELEKHEITTPALFWNISSIKDTEYGAIITYSDARIGVLIKMDRDTITGKVNNFKELHYDAFSDFYREIVGKKYSFVQLNIMEQAGKDPRLNELSKLVHKSDNPSIRKLMEQEVGYIKNITNTSLYESDYFLFYTTDISKVDKIIEDINDCVMKLLDGAFVGYEVLGSKGIVDLVKEMYSVNYFNATEASLMMFNNQSAGNIIPFTVSGILWTDGNNQTLTNVERTKLRKETSYVISDTKSVRDLALKDTFYKREDNNKIGIDLDEAINRGIKKSNKAKVGTRKSINNKNKQLNENNSTQNQVDNSDEYIDF